MVYRRSKSIFKKPIIKVSEKEILFQDLYLQFKEKLFRLCFSYCNEEAMANDLMQESFSKIWIHLDSFKKQAAYSTWMFRITANTCLMHIRSTKNKPINYYEKVPDAMVENPKDEGKVNQLYKAIQKLAETERIIISMVLEEISYKEIGEVLGISENSVGVKVHRIKKQLKDLLQNYF